jgi:phosphate transport system substrate-binding protein
MYSMKLTASAVAIAAVSATAAAARDQVQVAGSSTVLPYASIVAEAFGENFDFPTPVVESGGSSAGLKRFCEGVGENTIDIANASRAIREGEIQACADAGVTDWFLALAEQVPNDAGEIVANPNTTWADVNADLPAEEILAFIPGTKHGTREVFEEKVLLQGCEDTGAMQAFMDSGMDEDAAEDACMSVRTDGRSVDIDGDYTETLARIDSNANGVGVFGLAFYENNTDKLKVATMSGVEPSTETIASGEYPVSRPLYFYIKKAHIGVIPGLKEFAEFFVSDDMAGPDGPLSEYGLVSDPELGETQSMVSEEKTMGDAM